MSGLQPVEGFPELRLRLPRHLRLRFLIQVRWGWTPPNNNHIYFITVFLSSIVRTLILQ